MTRFSMELDGGIVSNFTHFQFICFDCCDFGNCPQSIYYAEPLNGFYSSFRLNYHVNEVHKIGLAMVNSKRGFTRVDVSPNNKFSSYKLLESYLAIALCHEMKLLHGENAYLGLGNDLQFDSYLGDVDYSSLYKHGLSHQASLILGLKASEHLELKLKGVARTALSRYGEAAFDGPFHRFGYGLLLGMDYRFGKLKYYSTQND